MVNPDWKARNTGAWGGRGTISKKIEVFSLKNDVTIRSDNWRPIVAISNTCEEISIPTPFSYHPGRIMRGIRGRHDRWGEICLEQACAREHLRGVPGTSVRTSSGKRHKSTVWVRLALIIKGKPNVFSLMISTQSRPQRLSVRMQFQIRAGAHSIPWQLNLESETSQPEETILSRVVKLRSIISNMGKSKFKFKLEVLRRPPPHSGLLTILTESQRMTDYFS
jgi:hypothetical protein